MNRPTTIRSRRRSSNHGTHALRVDARRLGAMVPAQGAWSAEDYLWLMGHARHRIELADGWIEELPVPSERHQRLVAYLYRLLHAWLDPRGGIVLFSALPMRIAERGFREPDLLALRDRRDPRRGEAYWSGADLVVEVVSPGNAPHDLVTKRAEYAAAGIGEYWIVDPERERLIVLALAGTSYDEHGAFERGERAASRLLDGLVVDVEAMFGDAS